MDAESYEVDIMVPKEILRSTHKRIMRLGNIAFKDVLFIPGLLQTLIIISERFPNWKNGGVRLFQKMECAQFLGKGPIYLMLH